MPVKSVATIQNAIEVGKEASLVKNDAPKITMQKKKLHQGMKMGMTPAYWIFEVLKSPSDMTSGVAKSSSQ